MCVAYFLDAMHRFLFLQAIDGGLDSGVSGPILFGKGLLNFANGAGAEIPQCLHNLQFEFAEFGDWQACLLPLFVILLYASLSCKSILRISSGVWPMLC